MKEEEEEEWMSTNVVANLEQTDYVWHLEKPRKSAYDPRKSSHCSEHKAGVDFYVDPEQRVCIEILLDAHTGGHI